MEKKPMYRVRGNLYEFPRPLSRADVLRVAEDIVSAQFYARETLTDPTLAEAYCKARLAKHPYEVFAVLFLDNRHRVLAFEEMFRGTVNGAPVYAREVVRRCLHHNAAAVVFSHNHPSGTTEPSAADRMVTQHLRDALALIDVRVLDHIVVAPGESSTSFARRGWL